MDDILAYSTPRYVKIKDARLGVVNLVLTSLILAYIVMYQV